MLVRERMISQGKRISADLPIKTAIEAYDKMDSPWLPVVDSEGTLVGLLTKADIKKAKITLEETETGDQEYLVQDFMTKKFLVVNENTPIEEAVRMMIDYDFDEMPVVKDSYFSGVITQKIMLRVLMEITGARRQGVRLMVEVENKTGELLRLMQTISDNKGNVQGFCTYCAPKDEYVIVTIRVEGVDKYTLKQAVKNLGQKVIDIR
ncbi:MAG: CBS domain-containing protein [Flexilinea sp.]|nr:CBS domain-containing protein [Flexilinea sp.]